VNQVSSHYSSTLTLPVAIQLNFESNFSVQLPAIHRISLYDYVEGDKVDSVVDQLQPIDPAVLFGGGGPAPVKKPAGLEGIPEDKIIAKKFDKEGNLIRVVYTNEDGEIVKKKIEPVTSGTGKGDNVTRYPDGRIVTRYPNGTATTRYPDGRTATVLKTSGRVRVITSTTTTRLRDGRIITEYPDGRIVTEYTDGSIQTEYLDGRMVMRYPEGKIVTRYPDDKVVIEHPDGRTETEYPSDELKISGISGMPYVILTQPAQPKTDVDSVVDQLQPYPPFSSAKEEQQFKLEKGWLGEEAATLNRETRQLDRETSVLTRKKKELEKDKEFLQGHREYLEDKLEKQENEVQEARENLDNTREAYERRIKKHKSETDEDRARQARREVVERYKEEYGEDWTESEANKDGDLTRQASEDVAKEMERLNNEWKEEGERLGQEAENAIEEAERDVRRAEGGADNTKRNLGKTNEMAEENSKELKDTESRLKEEQRAEDRNRRRQERLRRQERARQAREEARQRREEDRRQRAEERKRAAQEGERDPEWSGQRRATNQELQAAVKRAEMKVKAMKVFQAMYTWDGEKRIKPASGYEGSTDFSAKVDNSGKLLDMATNVLTEGLKKGFAGEASPAGDVAGTVRDSLDAIGETYNTMSQAFTTESAMGAGRFEGAYRNMTSFDDATKKTGVSFNNARERELVSRMVFQMAR
jgi:T-complex protein 10 C-terminus